MASWNEIKAKICKTTDKVVAKTSEVADTAAKHVKVKTIDGRLAEKYEELGRVYYVVLKGEEAEEGKAEAIVAEIEAVDKTAFADLVANVRKAEALANKALGELENENYTSEYKYVEKLGKEDWIFTLNKGEELIAEMQQIYMEFSNWLGSWEM